VTEETFMNKYALCIGINDYPGTANDLSGCVNDATDWAKVFAAKGYQVKKLLNRAATGAAMRRSIADLVGKAVDGDRIVIQYSGHGSYVPDQDGDEPDGTDECLCPYDIMSKGPLTDDELFELYNAKRSGVRIVVISDSCHSGTVAKFAAIVTPPSVRGRKRQRRLVRFLPPAVFLAKREAAKLGMLRSFRASNPPGRYAALLMAGCQDVEYSYDAYFNDRPNGAFTYVALRTLAALSSRATYSQWFKEIRKQLPSQQYPQRPNLFGSSSMKRWKVLE
jgi:metacaspase-1